MYRKAAGEIIAWVLLLGFIVSLSVSVFLWSKSQTEELTESTIIFVEGKLECSEVKINVKKQPDCTILNISNRGKLTIDRISISSLDGTNFDILNANLTPFQDAVFPYQLGSDIEVLPVITLGNQEVGCRDRKITVEC